MKVSLNIVKQFTDIDIPIDELVVKINEQLGVAEEIIDVAAKYKDVIIAKIITATPHPNADRLTVCMIDDGGVRGDVPRDDNGHVQVVCGAPNAREGIFVAWLPPASTVPASYDDKELFVLGARELRGVMSQGMLAAADELGIGSDHDGILEITPDEWKPTGIVATPGASFAKIYGLDDTVIDIENKMFTHRPDLFGQLGVAREIAGIQHIPFDSPVWYLKKPASATAIDVSHALSLHSFNDATQAVPRLMTLVINGVKVGASPLWLQCALTALGAKPINNIVDVTNYTMLLTAQPVHAYDYDILAGQTLGARMAQPGEKVTLLNQKTYDLDASDIVMVDGDGPVGLAGIMGGSTSEVSASTTNIVLEVATFDMYTVRKTSMRHGVFTDALTRFNKGQSPRQNDVVMDILTTTLYNVAGGRPASELYDTQLSSADSSDFNCPSSVHVTTEFINKRLGLRLDSDQISSLLTNVEFAVTQSEQDLEIAIPFWRTDIIVGEDIVEEVGRLHGFDKLPRELPQRSVTPAPMNKWRDMAQTIRTALARAGANEVLTYSFVHENVLTRAGQDPHTAYRLSNALSPELQYYRLSLTPSLIDKVRMNIKAGVDEFALFEIGKGHSKLAKLDDDGLPTEQLRVAMVYAAKVAQPGASYYRAKRMAEYLATSLGLSVVCRPLPADSTLVLAKPFEPKRSARLVDQASGQTIGIVGEYRRSVAKGFKLPAYSAGFELLPEAIMQAQPHSGAKYVPLSRYPSAERDICFQVDKSVAYGQLLEAVTGAVGDVAMTTTVQPLDIYQADDAATKNITVRLRFSLHDRTLTADEIAAAVEAITVTAMEQVDATIV
ncbi:MAG: phenylalanine--tRNA ligase subunit beta [Candidatus Saccharimonadales bacterium]